MSFRNFQNIIEDLSLYLDKSDQNSSIFFLPAKKIAKSNNFKNSFSIAILAYKEDEKKYIFLSKLKQALEIYFFETELVSAYSIEKENKWPDFFAKTNLKFIISSDYTISEL